jgi:signal-transduction protein with cAMP-binding, CBS, and nucleotidyltransferase domain/PAS domain-containing protein
MDTKAGKTRRRLFLLKIDLPAILALLLFAGLIFIYLIPGFEKVMMERKRNLIHEMTSSAYSLMEYYHSLEQQELMDEEKAKEAARSAINAIRYGSEQKDYFWITDQHPTMVMHPYRPELNGADLSNYRDSRGKTIFVDFVKAVSSGGESYVDYMWQWNDDSTRIVPKLSYVRLFEPWGWIIGTGIYIDDVRTEIRRIEYRALIISGSIGLLIVVMLLAMAGQSHRIEEQRSRAEEELKKSRELYQTLAEAASEGVLIWSVQGLQANKTLLSWLGFTSEELADRSLNQVLTFPGFPVPADAAGLYEELNMRRHAECVLSRKNGELLKVHADFSRIMLGTLQAVLVVLRPAESVVSRGSITTSSVLLKNTGTGFFRTTWGRKNRFLYASEPCIKMLGYSGFQELLPLGIETFFADHSQLKAFRQALASREDITEREVLLRRKSGDLIHALVSVTVVSEANETWCEGSIEMLSASGMEDAAIPAGLEEYSAAYVMEMPVASVMRPVHSVPANTPASQCIAALKESGSPYAVIVNTKLEMVGVVDAGTLAFRLSKGGSAETEIFRWMNPPAETVHPLTRVADAFGRLNANAWKVLVVKDSDGEMMGMLGLCELTGAFALSTKVLFDEIGSAGTPEALRTSFLNGRKIAISMIAGKADPYAVSHWFSSVADAIAQRIAGLCIAEAGAPPCKFAFIQTGSAGRMEQTLLTDQDNAIIIEDLEESRAAEAGEYFLLLGKRINSMLDSIGFTLCKGNNMAGNPRWCVPLATWKKTFSGWISSPGPEELLEVSIFFDFRFCHGNRELCDNLRDHVQSGLKTNDIFFHHMTMAWKPFNPSPVVDSGTKADLKRILMPLTGLVRMYGLKYGMKGLSTPDRIAELHARGGISSQLLRDVLTAWKDLTTLRLRHQADCIRQGKEPDNLVDTEAGGAAMRYITERAVTAIRELMLKAGQDFYTDVL